MRNKTADKPAPPAAPPTAWADDESQQTVIQANSRLYIDHAGAAHQYDIAAKRLAGEAEAISREVQEVQKRLDDKIREQRAADHDAQRHHRAAQAFAATITTLGGQVPAAPADGVRVHPPERQVPAREHAAQYGGPPPFTDDSPHGPCLNCGKPAWRKPVSPHHPQGATHSFGATCDPEAEEPTYADLGPREPLGFREAALQRPYVDPTPTSAHPLAQPEERPR